MAWGATLLLNGDASFGDTSHWNVGVTLDASRMPILDDRDHDLGVTRVLYDATINAEVEANSTVAVDIEAKTELNQESDWIDTPRLVLEGLDGTYCFVMAATGSMWQQLAQAAIGDTPDNFQLNASFKLPTAQELYDANILATITAWVYYNDGKNDTFVIPCVVGVNTSDHNLINDWLLVSATLATRDAIVKKVKITITTSGLTGGLKVNYVELRKQT